MAVARYQPKRNALKTVRTARTTAPQAAHLGQILAVQMTQIAGAAVTPTVTAEAAAVPNQVQIVKDKVGVRW